MVGEVEIAASGTVSIPVQRPSVTPGSLLVAILTKHVDHGEASVTDSKGNTWVFAGDEDELLDTAVTTILTCLVETELLATDTITFDHVAAVYGEKTAQVHEFRAAGVINVGDYADAHTVFPHEQPRTAGTATGEVGDTVVAAFYQNYSNELIWTPSAGLTMLSLLRPGESGEVLSVYGTLSGTSISPEATSNVDTAGAGVQVVLHSEPPTGPPEIQGAPSVIADVYESGQPAYCSTGWWAPGGETYEYQWQRADPGTPGTKVDIAGETSEDHLLVQLDVGTLLSCEVTATNEHGSATTSSTAQLIAQGPLPTAPSTLMLCYSGEWEQRSIRYPHEGGWT
jgi:hypothetical protein